MTLKQERTLRELPKNNYNIAKSMREAGYSDNTSRSGQQYARIRNRAKELGFFSKEAIERDIAQVRRLAKKKKDLTNLNRIDEHRSKIAGLITEKVQNLTPEKIIISYSNTVKKLDNSSLTKNTPETDLSTKSVEKDGLLRE